MGLALHEVVEVQTDAPVSKDTLKGPDTEDRAEAIKRQVEYYFSRQNLLQDTFLLSKMDKDHYVDLKVIADFKIMKQLTTDIDVIISSVRGSDKVVIDEEKKRIKPAATIERTTLILRNIPSSASEEAVRNLLTTADVKDIISIRSDVGDNWFVTFETQDATKAAMDRAKTLKWEGKQVGCAIKSESLLKGLAILPANALQYHSAIPYSANLNTQGNGETRGARRVNTANRRSAGSPGAENSDANSKRNVGGKKPKARTGTSVGKDGAANTVRSTQTRQETPQAPLNLSDFPVLGNIVSPTATENPALDANSGASTPPQCSTPPLSNGPATPTSETVAPQKSKMSYAQMALASVASNNTAVKA